MSLGWVITLWSALVSSYTTENGPQHWDLHALLLALWCVGSFTSQSVMNIEGLWDESYGLSSLSKQTRESIPLFGRCHLIKRQHLLLSYLKTLSVGLAGEKLMNSRMVAWCSTMQLSHWCTVNNSFTSPVCMIMTLSSWLWVRAIKCRLLLTTPILLDDIKKPTLSHQ